MTNPCQFEALSWTSLIAKDDKNLPANKNAGMEIINLNKPRVIRLSGRKRIFIIGFKNISKIENIKPSLMSVVKVRSN